MSSSLFWNNLITYSLQVGLLVAVAAFIPTLLRLRLPAPRLAFWHILLATCLFLPLLRPWRQEVINGTVRVSSTVMAIVPSSAPAPWSIPRTELALLVLAAGAVIRLAWLGVGLWRLRRYRRHSQLIEIATPWYTPAELRIAEEIVSPVTFGLFRPVVLLPVGFEELDAQKQNAILCHELLHVQRGDWLFTVAEEVVRAIFWFHPAIWWLLGEIQLSREQAVDRKVIELTQARDEYVDALLAIAGASTMGDLAPAPAPLFLRKRHLKQRVVSILKEVRMSRTRMISALAGGLGILAMTCWFVTSTFPLAAAPQVVTDGEGITVDVGGATLMHRSGVMYPEAARVKGVQGNVVLEVTLDGSGNVSDARVLSGPDELRKPAIQSVLTWHFGRESAGLRRQVTIGFQLLPPAPRTVVGVAGGVVGGVPDGVQGGVRGGVIGGIIGSVPSGPEGEQLRTEIAARKKLAQRERMTGQKIKAILFYGMSDSQSQELRSRLPIHAGDTITPEVMAKATEIVKDFDEHLSVVGSPQGENEFNITISTGFSAVPLAAPATDSPLLQIGGNVQQTKLIQQPRPMYPPTAKQARIQGVVRLKAIIAKDGTIKHLEVINGHPLLVPAALEAVIHWVYEPTLLNGEPVEVQTQIDVNFTLSE